MTPLTIPALANGALDLQHIAAVATSTANTAIDRIGGVKPTVYAAMRGLATFNVRGAWATGTAYALKDVYVSGGTVYVATLAHVSSSVAADLAAGRVAVHQGATREDLAAPTGSDLSGYQGAGAGAVATTVHAVLRESISIARFGVTPGNPDNTSALAVVVAFLATFADTGLLPKITIPPGQYTYTDSPNWAITGLCLKARGNVVFKHTGSGSAFNLDGGATGPGVYGVHVLGRLRITGNVNTTRGVYARAVHHSQISVRPINCATALETAWCVCTEFDVRCSPVGYPTFTNVPVTGLLLGKRNAGETTSACTFFNPIMEGISGYGIKLEDAVQNTFLGGTSESNGGGLFISLNSGNNRFNGLDLEFNTDLDIFCQGPYNTFDTVLSDKESTFGGVGNVVLSGIYNKINSVGVVNEFIKTNYGAKFGVFTDTGTNTIKRSVRNIATGTLDPELVRNPHKLLFIAGPVDNNTVMGSDDQIGGGPANDFSLYHYGTGEVVIWGQNVKKIRASGVGVGFNAAPPMAKPAIAGSRGGNAALAALLTQLAAYGLITDSTIL